MKISSSDSQAVVFGQGDASFQAAGGEAGLRRLVDAFYDEMEANTRAEKIRNMHPRDLATSRDKLARFLCGWLNGPNRYREKYGPISLPGAHAHLNIGMTEHDAWLACMETAIAAQDYSDAFKRYLYAQFCVPAARVVNSDEKSSN